MRHKTVFSITMVVIILVNLSGCLRREPPEPRLVLRKTSFANLSGWQEDDQRGALKAFKRSCIVINKQNPGKLFSKSVAQAGRVYDWQNICIAVDKLQSEDAADVRGFFEYWFEPYKVYDNSNPEGLFTGYYLPKLNCSLRQSKRFKVPIYALPDDWVKVNLGLFHPELKGRSVVGKVKNKRLVPYADRKAIARGAIRKKAKVLAWCDNKVDVAFAHIQGSASVELPNGKGFLINYVGSNGRAYTSIGRFLVKLEELTLEKSSMQDIRSWFVRNPKKVDAILDKNASYVFFRILKNKNPLGAQQVPLTPGRSLAVDRRYIQLGIPVWLDTEAPDYLLKGDSVLLFKRLMVAQDTGGAIKGVVRGDVYWGSGKRAAFIAGKMKNLGGYWLLLPRKN